MRIELPFPSSKLHAHAKGHWRSKAEATKTAREIAKLASIKAAKLSGPVQILYEFYVPDLRQRDEANLIQACKPYIDGIVDAGVCEGDDWQRMSITGVSTVLDRDNPRVVLHFTERT
jgi:hypothetical protein